MIFIDQNNFNKINFLDFLIIQTLLLSIIPSKLKSNNLYQTENILNPIDK